MIILNEYLGGKVNKRKKLIPRNKEELRSIIEQRLKESPDLDLNDIDESAVKDMKNLFEYLNVRSVDISEWDIDVVDDEMFYGCDKLESVILPDSVENIGESAFRNCKSLININISDSVKCIEQYAFYNCDNLTKIDIPDSVKSIGDSAFSGCNSLIKIIIPDSVESVGDYAFLECRSLTDINIPDSVESIGWDAFYNIPHITYHGPATWISNDKYWGAKSMN